MYIYTYKKEEETKNIESGECQEAYKCNKDMFFPYPYP